MNHSTPQPSALKVCPKCGQAKPLTEFYIRKSGKKAGKPRSACKACEKVSHATYRAANPGVDAAYKAAHREEYAAYESARRATDRESYNAYMREWQASRPDRRAAVNAVNNAARAGKLPHVSTLACIECGEQAEHYHHYLGYASENRLKVVPLCRLCHEQEHHANG